jgi:hypothetical protein
MNSSQQSSFQLPKYFRAYGFLFFMAGAFFHCMDFLGVEDTVMWGMGLTFLGALLLSLLLWTRYAINRKVWKYLV